MKSNFLLFQKNVKILLPCLKKLQRLRIIRRIEEVEEEKKKWFMRLENQTVFFIGYIVFLLSPIGYGI